MNAKQRSLKIIQIAWPSFTAGPYCDIPKQRMYYYLKHTPVIYLLPPRGT